MGILRKIKENKLLNRFVRQNIKRSSKWSAKFHRFLINRWTTSGIIDCNFGPYKFKYYNKCDDGHLNYFYYDLPYHEKADLNLFIELSKRAKTALDIGANTGLFSVLASIANPNVKIHAIEPYNVNSERLKINLNLNDSKNVIVHELAIGDKDGVLQLYVPKDKSITDVSSFDSGLSKGYYPDVIMHASEVQIQTLDTFSKKNNIHINLIKCDVEMFEMEVFKGADKVLREDKPTIIFECLLDAERKVFFDSILSNYGYYVYLIFEQGIVHVPEGFTNISGLNYLVTPVKPSRTFINYKDTELIINELLYNPTPQ